MTEVAAAAGASALVAVLKPDLRRALDRDARLSNVVRNFSDPVGQVRRGTRRDTDPFWVNNVSHPGLFALEALALKRRGRSDRYALVFTQVHSVVWEFVIEGSAFEPSGKDLLMDAAGAVLAIHVLRPAAEGATRRLATGRGRRGDRLLRLLDPVSAVAPRRLTVVAGPAPDGLVLGVAF